MVCAVPDFSGKLTPKQQSAFDTLCAIGTVTVRELSYYTGVSVGIIRTLADKGAAEILKSSASDAQSRKWQTSDCRRRFRQSR